MRAVKFDHYFRYDELIGILTDAATSHPDLVTQFSIGKTSEGRDIPGVAVTNRSTGEARAPVLTLTKVRSMATFTRWKSLPPVLPSITLSIL